ncbi:hypothetical protein LA080_014916 [Diaporthe eres]|nr:hypothetical protein LA080_014916 [Diaporthe eres]
MPTKAVLYGCKGNIRNGISDRLKGCNHVVYHLLTIPALFCDIERNRHFHLLDPVVKKFVKKAVNISKPQNLASRSSKLAYSSSTASADITSRPGGESEDLMKLWLQVSDLKRGLETWKQQLENLILHCETLGTGQTRRATEDPEDLDARQLMDAGKRIKERLVELKCEYDEKIRQCADIIDGMVLVAQLKWNTIGQNDTQTNLIISRTNNLNAIAEATQADSKRMRSIFTVTMVFLPATFVATVFSMTLFKWSPEHDQEASAV